MLHGKLIKNLTSAHSLFIALSVVFGLIFVTITPPLWAPDEPAHFFRSYELSQGNAYPDKVNFKGDIKQGWRIPKSFEAIEQLTAYDIQHNAFPDRQVDNKDAYSSIANPIIGKKTVTTTTGVSIYPPITYLAPATGIFITSHIQASGSALIWSARAATLTLFIILVAAALYLLRNTSVKWIVFAVALLPTSIFQASVVSADSVVFGLIIMFFALCYRFTTAKKHIPVHDVILATLISVLFVAIKPSYVILSFLPFFMHLDKNIEVKKARSIKMLIPFISIIFAIIAVFLARSIVGGPQPVPGTNLHLQLRYVIMHPFSDLYMLANSVVKVDWVPQIIGIFGASFVMVPGIITQAMLIGLVLITFLKERDKATLDLKCFKITGWASLLLASISAVAIIFTLFLTWTPVGANIVQGVQGRYFLPVLPFFMLGIRLLSRWRLSADEASIKLSLTTLFTVCLAVSVFWYYSKLY